MNLTEISWPVYRLKEYAPSNIGGALFYAQEREDGEEVVHYVDDKGIGRATLGHRRLVLASEKKYRLYPLKLSFWFLADLIKAAGKYYFIDNNGKVFRYTKTRMARLTCKKITKVQTIPGGCLIEVDGLPNRFTALFPPKPEQKYASILEIDGPILYGYSETKHEDTRRKV